MQRLKLYTLDTAKTISGHNTQLLNPHPNLQKKIAMAFSKEFVESINRLPSNRILFRNEEKHYQRFCKNIAKQDIRINFDLSKIKIKNTGRPICPDLHGNEKKKQQVGHLDINSYLYCMYSTKFCNLCYTKALNC